MSTPTNEMPSELDNLKNVLKSTVAQLMAHSQTVQELLKANMDLRANLHMLQTAKNGLEEYVHNLLNPPAAEPAASEEVSPTQTDTSDAPVEANADPVSA